LKRFSKFDDWNKRKLSSKIFHLATMDEKGVAIQPILL